MFTIQGKIKENRYAPIIIKRKSLQLPEENFFVFEYYTFHFCTVMKRSNRKSIDCRSFPNEFGCTLTISGSTNEVLKVALRHAIEEHGHKDTPELRKQLKTLLKEETNKNKSK